MPAYKKMTLAPIAVGITVFVLIIFFLMAFRALTLREESDNVAHTLLKQLESIARDANEVLVVLNNYGYSGCNERTLLAMRQQLFFSPYIVDIGFLDGNDILCTTGAGILTEPVSDGAPSYVSANGNEIRLRPNLKLLQFDNQYMRAVLVRRGHFNVVIDPARMNILDVPYLRWEAVYTARDSIYTLAGTEGTYRARDKQSELSSGYFSQCSKRMPNYCIAVQVDDFREMAHRRFEIAFFFAISLALSIAAGVLCQHSMVRRRSIKARVKRGLQHHKFFWLYQPIVDMRTGQVLGCEALARFEDAFGALTPDKFIPCLRELELTWPFTELMIKRILEDLEPIAALPSEFRVSINIFPFDIEKGHVGKLPEVPGLSRSRFKFTLEVTEDEYLDSPVAHQYLEHIAQQGYGVAIDDFGTGYSNLKTLTMLRFDYLKIDRSFVKDIETRGLKSSVIPQVIDIASKFGLEVIAEGVETAGQHEILQNLGVHYGQGWRYGKPMAPEELANLVRLHTA